MLAVPPTPMLHRRRRSGARCPSTRATTVRPAITAQTTFAAQPGKCHPERTMCDHSRPTRSKASS
eukprot:6511091-Lingulodinium_polyedra.AAC.1